MTPGRVGTRRKEPLANPVQHLTGRIVARWGLEDNDDRRRQLGRRPASA